MLKPASLTAACVSVLLAAVACAGDVAVRKFDSAAPTGRDAHTLYERGTSLTLMEASRLTEHLRGDEFVLVPHGEGVSVAGAGIGVGVSAGQTVDTRLRDGLWWFPEGGILHDAEGFPVIVAQRGIVLVGLPAMHEDLYSQAADNGGVTCDDGYYACCGKNQHGQWRARCVLDGLQPLGGDDDPESCIHGGAGSKGCTNGTSIIAFEVMTDADGMNSARRVTKD